MAKRSSKSATARQKALEAQQELIDRQNTILKATQDGFLALEDYAEVASRLGNSFQTLLDLGETRTGLSEMFGLEMAHVRLVLKMREDEQESGSSGEDGNDVEAQDVETITSDAAEPIVTDEEKGAVVGAASSE